MTITPTNQWSKYLIWAEALVVFFMPINIHLDTYCILLFVLVWLLSKGWKNIVREKRAIKWAFLFSSIFFAYFLRALFPPGFKMAQHDIAEKLSLLVFPFLLLGIGNVKNKLVLNALPAGCLLASIICLVNAAMQYKIFGYQAFFYTFISRLMHPGYFSMYINFAIFILLYQLLFSKTPINTYLKWGYILLIVFFMVMIIFLSSKAGIIGFYIVMILGCVFFYMDQKKLLRALMILSGTVIIYILFSSLILRGQPDRLTQTSEALVKDSSYVDTTETAEIRLMIWQSSFEVIKNNFAVGVGTGAEENALKEVYIKRNMAHAFNFNLNAHNQFIQTFIALGIIGFMVLLIIIAVPAWYSLMNKKYIFLAFIILIAFNFLTESMLQTQAGIVFYAFFNSYLFNINEEWH